MLDCVAIIGDIHGNTWALDAVLADIDRRRIATVVILGDCCCQ
jgi:predicted phosphodiesterase